VSEQSPSLVSVIIPVFNGEKFLPDSLRSIFDQDYPNVEVIAVDDGSTDGSLQILERYRERITTLRQANAGPAAARNLGLRCARGEFIAFLDADDLWHPAKLRLQVAEFRRRPDVGLVYNRWLVCDDDEPAPLARLLQIEPSPPPHELEQARSGWLYHKLFLDCLVHSSSAMVRKELIDRVGLFDETLERGEDYEYWFRLSREAPFHKLAATLSVYRVHADGTMQRPTRTNHSARVLNRVVSRWGRRGPDGSSISAFALRSRLATLWYGFGHIHLERGDRRIARSSFFKACMLAPWRPGGWRSMLRSLLPARGVADNSGERAG
jgi:glycosyltransferase involved in cell wall biosynthesis